MLMQLYLRNGMVYLPTVAQTEAGYHMDIDPVDVVSVTDTKILQRAIKEALSKGNPTIPTPTRAAHPTPVVLKYAKVKSWSAFEKGTSLWKLVEKSGSYQIKPGRKRPDKGWEDDPTTIETLPSVTTLDEVAKRVLILIQNSSGVAPPNVG